MDELIHGGDVYTDRCLPEGVPLLDFSANLNPLGMPESVRQTLAGCAEQCGAYPDPLCRALRRALAEREGVPAERIVCGNGAADLIYRLVWALRPKRALIPAPTFAEYALALEGAGCRVEYAFLLEKEGFAPCEALLDAVKPGVELVFFCNPNNPTGVLSGREYLLRLAERCREAGAVLAVDECFLDFADGGDECSLVPELERFPNIAVLKAFTKLYAMAGLRLGYLLCGGEELAGRVSRAGQAWSVSTPAQLCGLAALEAVDYASRTRDAIRGERDFLRKALEKAGCRVYGSKANYLFFRSGWDDLPERLLSYGILVRSCGNYPGLDKRYCRIAVRTSGENLRFVECLQKIADGEETAWQKQS